MRSYEEIDADAADERTFSNMTEYEIWADRWCFRCTRDVADPGCPILGVALLGSWPREWTRKLYHWKVGNASGSYEVVGDCTEFEERRDDGPDDPEPEPEPPPDCDGQLDLIDAYLDTAISELSAEVVRA